MRRSSTTGSALLLAVLFLVAGCRGTSGQDAKEEAVKKARLNSFYQAYQAYEVSYGKPANKVDDLALGKEDVKELKRWLSSLTEVSGRSAPPYAPAGEGHPWWDSG